MSHEKPELRQPRGLKRAGLSILSAIPSIIAALAKGFTYTFGALTLLNLMLTGAVAISTATLFSPLLPLACILGASVVFISLGMEGKELFHFIYATLASFFGFSTESDTDKPNTKDTFERIKQPQENKKHQKAQQSEPTSWLTPFKWFFSKLAKLFGATASLLATTCKALNGAAGTIATLLFLLKATGVIATITLSGPIGIAVITAGVIAGFAVGSVCAGKEGYTFYKLTKRLSRWLYSETTQASEYSALSTEKTNTPSPAPTNERPYLKQVLAIVSGILPTLAALAKMFSYTFGVLNLLNFIFMGTLTVTAATLASPLLPIACIFGAMLFPISFGMEGASLFRKIQRRLHKFFGLKRPPSKKERAAQKKHVLNLLLCKPNNADLVSVKKVTVFLYQKNKTRNYIIVFPNNRSVNGTVDASKINNALGTSFFKTTTPQDNRYNLTAQQEEKLLKSITSELKSTTSLPISSTVTSTANVIAAKAATIFSYFAPAASALAKGASGTFGTIAMLLFILKATSVITVITFTAPVSITIVALGIIAGLTIAGVSLAKEGRTFHGHAIHYKQGRTIANQILLLETQQYKATSISTPTLSAFTKLMHADTPTLELEVSTLESAHPAPLHPPIASPVKPQLQTEYYPRPGTPQ